MRQRAWKKFVPSLSLTTLLFAVLGQIPSFAEPTSDQTLLVHVQSISGSITPKSVRASGDGLVSAHNMMYQHSITLYDAESMRLIKTIPDTVDLSALGFSGYSGEYRGAPVEGAYSPDGQYLYVTNYAMYGKGFNKEGHDTCTPNSKYDRSFLYRINLTTQKIDAAYKVGVVPKVVQVTPDNKYILVTNWCSYDLSVISVEDQRLIKSVKIGAYPRGIVVTGDSKTAYVAQMGGVHIHAIDLTTFKDRTIYIGSNPRAIVLSPDEKYIYATLNQSGKVVALNLETRKVVRAVKTGKETRSLDISTDGTALFVVNFGSATVSKIRTRDFTILQTLKVCSQPIGVTYEPTFDRTWVACYLGSIQVFDNK